MDPVTAANAAWWGSGAAWGVMAAWRARARDRFGVLFCGTAALFSFAVAAAVPFLGR